MGEADQIRIEALVEDARVHRDVYASEAVFKLEMERIWGRAWLYVGHVSQVPAPGDFITTTLGLTPVVMVRHTDGDTVHVLQNRCGHRGAIVCYQRSGHAKSGLFRCPYHGWIFRSDGSLRTTPSPRGYEDVGFDRDDPAFGMPRLPRVGIYRGFVFASLSETGPDLETFLGETRATIDNMVDRAPDGEVEVTGRVGHRFRHRNNWKFFIENLHDAMHPMVAHAATGDAVRQYVEAHPDTDDGRPEAEVIAPFGGSYDFFDEMGFVGLPLGHGYMGGSKSIFSHYEMYPDYLASMHAVYGEERTREILSYNKHNTLVYPSCTVRDGIQSIRVVKPVSVNETVIESWTFRLKGAPQDMLDRTLRYSRLINSPASCVGPDDLSCYDRIQEAAETRAIQWIDLHRHLGRDEQHGDTLTAIGTSDLALRNQYRAWLDYMVVD
ncbi:MAG: Rieske 2Fe-2S domain-containing protein [Gammaproteobacteria bacterium]|nr:Rieske 2Fe-2S domain-containing protein [Gammaproteobacteria bacterium]